MAAESLKPNSETMIRLSLSKRIKEAWKSISTRGHQASLQPKEDASVVNKDIGIPRPFSSTTKQEITLAPDQTVEKPHPIPFVYITEINPHTEEGQAQLEKQYIREDIQRYVDFLHDPHNRPHFAHPPESAKELIEQCKENQNIHPLIVKDRNGTVVAGAVIEDANYPQTDDFISLFSVDPDKQNRGFGTSAMIRILEWGFSHNVPYINKEGNPQMRRRLKLDLAVVEGIAGYRKMTHLVRKLKFRQVGINENQIEVVRPSGRKDIKNTLRFSMTKSNWGMVRKDYPQMLAP